jgi:hypothetical protein
MPKARRVWSAGHPPWHPSTFGSAPLEHLTSASPGSAGWRRQFISTVAVTVSRRVESPDSAQAAAAGSKASARANGAKGAGDT